MKKEYMGILQMTLCAALWSISGVLFKYVPWNPLVIAGARGVLAGLVMLGFFRFRHYRIILNRKTVLAGLSSAATCILFVVANKLTTAANAIVLQYTAPVFLMVLSTVFLKEKFRKEDMMAVAVTLGGISLFFFDQLGEGALAGNLIAVFTGFTMAVMYLVLGKASEAERMSAILVGEIVSVVVSIPFFFTTEILVTSTTVILILLLGIFQLGIPYVLYTQAAGKCSALSCCLIGALEPLLNPLWVMIFYGETPGPFALAGGLVVVGSVTMWSIQSARRKAPDAEDAVQTAE